MSPNAACQLAQRSNPSQYRLNEVAAYLAMSIMLLTLVFYLWNAVALIHQMYHARPGDRRQRKHQRHDLNINPLSALLAAAFGIVVIFETWPQSLEGAGVLVVVLAQASMLAWQDHDPEYIFGDLAAKVPDLAAVVVAAYALGDARQKYMDLTKNEFAPAHDPRNQQILAWVFTGTGGLVGLVQEVWARTDRPDAFRRRALTWCSAVFAIIQAAAFVSATVLGNYTLPDGCTPFNAAKIAGMVTLGVGVLYSVTIAVMRSKLLPFRDDVESEFEMGKV